MHFLQKSYFNRILFANYCQAKIDLQQIFMQKIEPSKQLEFFARLKNLIPPNTSMVQELADLLQISSDSMYRRLRGETSLTFDEIITLCQEFKISFDSFIGSSAASVTFNYTQMESGELSFKNYLISTRNDLLKIRNAPNPHIIYACEDIPIFHNINFIDIASFKMMYWMKAILNVSSLDNQLFNSQAVPNELKELGKEIYQLYCSIPSTEIWTETTIRSTLKQIEFFWEAGMFSSKEDALNVIDSLNSTLEIIQKQTEQGSKSLTNPQSSENQGNYSVYFSEIELTNNCVFVKMGDIHAVYLGHLTFNTMNTTDATYCRQTEKWLENLVKKSTLISQVAEKTRYKFFQGMYQSIVKLVEQIKSS